MRVPPPFPLVLLALALAAPRARAQGAPTVPIDIRSVRTPCGVTVVVNHGETRFTLELAGRDATWVKGDPARMIVDGTFVEVAVTARAELGEGAEQASGQRLLGRHLKWEADRFNERRGWAKRPQAGGAAIKLASGRPARGWLLTLREPIEMFGVKVDRIVHVTAVVDDRVLDLSSPIPVGEADLPALKVLIGYLGTLTPSAAPLDAEAVARAAKADADAGRGCVRAPPVPRSAPSAP